MQFLSNAIQRGAAKCKQIEENVCVTTLFFDKRGVNIISSIPPSMEVTQRWNKERQTNWCRREI